MPKIDNILQQQPQEIANKVMEALDRREKLKNVGKTVYSGDLSWKKVTSESEHHKLAKYQPNQPTLASLTQNHSKKLDII
ncbi:MAG: hypothetical protein ACJAT2_000127 [Bacteriovoracaceae bacterium]|jgi:hypothetical protein